MIRRLAPVLILAAVLAPSAAAYPWPIKPFDVQHAVRGAFDDPRSLRGSIDPTIDNPLSFHDGVDIQAPDGTPVYAIEAGRISHPTPSAIAVVGTRIFGYWHIVPVAWGYVRRGQLLGYVRPGAGHVHLSEKLNGSYVNPLRSGGLSPYVDDTPPVVRSLVFYRCGTAAEIDAHAVDGCVDVAVDAYDPPALAPHAPWAGAILSPTRITWSGLFGFGSWRPLEFRAQTVDFTRFSYGSLREVYAPGTRQNQPNWPGDYRYRLARNVDTTMLENGSHTIWVTATDVRGNSDTAGLDFTVANPAAG